jgi:upstream activation factor subunit UAF30
MASRKKPAAKRRAAKKQPVRKSAARKAPTRRKTAARRKPGAASKKAIQPDKALAAVIGNRALPRGKVTKKVWSYIKKNNLETGGTERLVLPAALEPRYLTHGQIQSMVKSLRK